VSTYARELPSKKLGILKESLSDSDKQYVIKRAATGGQATLATAIFGSGSDFFCVTESLRKREVCT